MFETFFGSLNITLSIELRELTSYSGNRILLGTAQVLGVTPNFLL